MSVVPTVLSTGNYVFLFNSQNLTVSGTYPSIKVNMQNSSSGITSSLSSNQVWFQYAADTNAPICYTNWMVTDSFDGFYGYLVNQSNQVTLQFSFSKPTNGMYFGQLEGLGVVLYDPVSHVYFIPDNNGNLVAAFPGSSQAYDWQAQPYACNVQMLPTGSYLLKGLQVSSNLPVFVGVDQTNNNVGVFPVNETFNNTFSLVWQYDASHGILSTLCTTSLTNPSANVTYFLVFDPNSSHFPNSLQVTNIAPSPNQTKLLLHSQGVMTGDQSIQFVLQTGPYGTFLSPAGCLAPSLTPVMAQVISPSLPPSISSGSYQISFNNLCLEQDGSLQTCSKNTNDSVDTNLWIYDSSTATLKNVSSGQCLWNLASSCTQLPSQVLSVGACNDPKANRFWMGTDGKLYDPSLGFCYATVSKPSLNHSNHSNHSNLISNSGANSKSNSKSNFKSTSTSVLVILGMVMLFGLGYYMFVVSKKSKQTK